MASASAMVTQSHSSTFHGILAANKRDDVTLKLSSSSAFYGHHATAAAGDSGGGGGGVVPASTSSTDYMMKEGSLPKKVSSTSSSSSSSSTSSPTSITSSADVADLASQCKPEGGESIERNASIEGVAVLDENSTSSVCSQGSSSSSSLSTSSSSGSPSRKRSRRPETEMLVQDLMGMHKSFAEKLNQETATQIAAKTPVGGAKPEDSPAFRLRPRRMHRMPGGGYSSSGSNSPIYLSPLKRPRNTGTMLAGNSYTSQLLTDTSRRLSSFYGAENNRWESTAETITDRVRSLDIMPDADDGGSQAKAAKPKLVRSICKSILREVDISVFAEFISPLSVKPNNIYPLNYISLLIEEVRPMKTFVGDAFVVNSYLELVCSDTEDRFQLGHIDGLFDIGDLAEGQSGSNSTQEATKEKWRLYLVGTYAHKAKGMVAPGLVINVAQFRTATTDGRLVIVDAPKHDVAVPVKVEDEDDEEEEDKLESDHFAEIYGQSKPIESVSEHTWVPLVSLTDKWRAPANLSELNKTLYNLQPSIPKYEGTSRTVKM